MNEAASRQWTWAGQHLPWLRGEGVHVAAAGLESTVAKGLTTAGYVYAHASSSGVDASKRYAGIAGALRLRDSCANSLDALADSLRDLALLWPGRHRIVLLWSAPDELMHVDMLAFVQVLRVLAEASNQLWADEQLVFETVLFMPPPFAADHP